MNTLIQLTMFSALIGIVVALARGNVLRRKNRRNRAKQGWELGALEPYIDKERLKEVFIIGFKDEPKIENS